MANNKRNLQQNSEKKSWYNDRYEFVVVQRNIFALVTLCALLLSIAATFSISQLTPLKSVEPFVIQIDQKSGVTQVVDPVKARELTAQESVNNYFLVQYIRARESWVSQDRNYYNYNLVRVFSDTRVFAEYQYQIVLSNPESPAVRLGNYGSRDVHISSIKVLNTSKDAQGDNVIKYIIRAQVTERGANGAPSTKQPIQKIIIMEIKYVELDLSIEDRYLNPIGFRVVSYRADEDNLTQ